MKKEITIFIVLLLLAANIFAQSASVIVNKNSKVQNVSNEELRKIYLGKKEMWGDGSRIVLAFLSPEKSNSTNLLFDSVLGMDVLKFRKYWVKKLFAGNGIKPNEFDTEQEVIDFVMKNPGAIGVVSSGVNENNIRVVTQIK